MNNRTYIQCKCTFVVCKEGVLCVHTMCLCPHPNVIFQCLNLNSNFISNQHKPIQYDTIQNNPIGQLFYETVFNEITSKWLLPWYSCLCCLVGERVLCYMYLDWQNDQHTINYEIVRQAHCRFRQTNVLQVYSNRLMKLSLTGYNEVTKKNQLIEKWCNEQKRIANELKRTEERMEYQIEYEQHWQQQCFLFGRIFSFCRTAH